MIRRSGEINQTGISHRLPEFIIAEGPADLVECDNEADRLERMFKPTRQHFAQCLYNQTTMKKNL